MTHTGQGEVRYNCIYSNRACDLHIEAPPEQLLVEANGSHAMEDDPEFQKFFSWGSRSPGKMDRAEREVRRRRRRGRGRAVMG